jgi:hypothetical protein
VPFGLALLAAILPQVEAPFPDRIGLGFPISTAGAAGVVAGIVHSRSSPGKRDRAISLGSLLGFGVGGAVYLVALIVQVSY